MNKTFFFYKKLKMSPVSFLYILGNIYESKFFSIFYGIFNNISHFKGNPCESTQDSEFYRTMVFESCRN